MKHTEFWQEVARGEAEQWECNDSDWGVGNFRKPAPWLDRIYINPDAWTLRRKPRTIVVNGVECVAGYKGEIEDGTEYAFPCASDPRGFEKCDWHGDEIDLIWRKLVGVYIGPDKEAQAGAVGRAMRLPTEAKP